MRTFGPIGGLAVILSTVGAFVTSGLGALIAHPNGLGLWICASIWSMAVLAVRSVWRDRCNG